MRGEINVYRKGQHQAKGVNYRGGAICGGGEEQSVGTAFRGWKAGIVYMIG